MSIVTKELSVVSVISVAAFPAESEKLILIAAGHCTSVAVNV